ncbi:MAG: DNA-deoxyinosine glycosylase [Clostridia bacterium]|nr:DNA-deoxyinosine glycosylase [Clostridia bacterium]
MQNRIYGFPPVEDENVRILIVGSMPSVASLDADFYYGHPRNAFWPIMANVFSVKACKTVEEKKALLLKNNIALWDVYKSCVRVGSLDSAIREGEKNDFVSFFKTHPNIRAVLCNGTTAYQMFDPSVCPGLPVFRLPSTSPACTKKFDLKLSAWKQALTESLKEQSQ